MIAFIQYTMQIIMAFLMLSMVSIMLPRAAVSASRIDEVLETEVTIGDVLEPQHLNGEKGSRLDFKDVLFRYPGAVDNVLSGINFSAKPGQTTAFIGSTGSGKTTLVSLILRLYDVTSGEISINGVDIRKLPLHELRERIGYVPQKALLFSWTIESNIEYGMNHVQEKKLNYEEELYNAAETSQALEFIRENPEGLKAAVSQGGMNFSGGQKQRLAIARALAKKPDIYIFDDSFSALDFKTDATLRQALKKETVGSTVLIVAQRISTIMDADRIIVLEAGKIAGTGTHRELMQSCKVYQQIVLSQLSAEELAI
jgi:ATP-binding cassette subfamily B protein